MKEKRPVSLTDHQIRLLRMQAQQLIPAQADPANSPAQVLDAAAGVQAQEIPAALLGVRARSGFNSDSHLSAAVVEQARQINRSVIWTWAMRGTLHLISTADARWLLSLFAAPLLTAGQRRFYQLGWDETSAAAGLQLLAEAASNGPLTRADIVSLLRQHHLPYLGQAPVHLIYRAVLTGLLCHGPDQGKKPTWVRRDQWIGELQPLPVDQALERLIRRYLQAFGPAGPEDFAAWSGLKIGSIRAVWQRIEHEFIQVSTSSKPMWMLEAAASLLENLEDQPPAVRLLPRFDNYLLGYQSRSLMLDPVFASRINAGGGIITATLLTDGQIAGTWKLTSRRGGQVLTVDPFGPLSTVVWDEVEKEAQDIARYSGIPVSLERHSPR